MERAAILFRLDNTFLLAFLAPSNFLTETISVRVMHITGPAHNVIFRLRIVSWIPSVTINFYRNSRSRSYRNLSRLQKVTWVSRWRDFGSKKRKLKAKSISRLMFSRKPWDHWNITIEHSYLFYLRSCAVIQICQIENKFSESFW